MKVASLETLFCDAGWRPWIFLKATADDGLVGWAEITDSHGSPRGLAGIVEDLAPVVVGKDPRAVEKIYWELYRSTRQSPGSVIAKAIGGIENALLDLKAKALGVPVYELFGGPTRETIPLYWSHCGTTRARAWEVTGTPEARLLRRRRRARARGGRARVPRVQDEHRAFPGRTRRCRCRASAPAGGRWRRRRSRTRS